LFQNAPETERHLGEHAGHLARRRAAGASHAAASVALDASASVGLGHLVRLACLRAALRTPAMMIGATDAHMGADGLRIRRRTSARPLSSEARVAIVDRNIIAAEVLAWRLKDPTRRVIWIRRGNASHEQAIAQLGFVAFADLIIAPGDLDGDRHDPLLEFAARREKLRQVGVCHAYQVMEASPAPSTPAVFISLGAFEPAQRAAFTRIRDAVAAAGLPFLWSAYNDSPLKYGFPRNARVAINRSLRVKSQCAAIACEGGYNSLHEALYLARPALFVPNDSNGRERQSARVRAATTISPRTFDALHPGSVEAWLESIPATPASQHDEVDYGPFIHGFGQIANLVEDFCAAANAGCR
jgi:hypothetical protein